VAGCAAAVHRLGRDAPVPGEEGRQRRALGRHERSGCPARPRTPPVLSERCRGRAGCGSRGCTSVPAGPRPHISQSITANGSRCRLFQCRSPCMVSHSLTGRSMPNTSRTRLPTFLGAANRVVGTAWMISTLRCSCVHQSSDRCSGSRRTGVGEQARPDSKVMTSARTRRW
jgi:hypothetical protein